MSAVIHWFRRDLRLRDNTALNAALASGELVIPLFIFDERIYKSSRSSAARMAFVLKALQALDDALRQHNSRLLVRFGQPASVLRQLCMETQAQALYLNADYSPAARQRDQQIAQSLDKPVYVFDDALLVAPGQVLKEDGSPYTVFTPFKRSWLALPKGESRTANGRFHTLEGIENQALPKIHDLGFSGTIDVPDAGEAAALARLDGFARQSIFQYSEGRNRLAYDPMQVEGGSSFLSPYLHMGILSIQEVYWRARAAYAQALNKAEVDSVEVWVSELVWREFYHHILFHFPRVVKDNFRSEFDGVQWRDAPDELQAWKDGRTGYPVVDAAMRQLNATGWMPNRARMIVASFLCKDLLIDWREGELYFMQRLIDGDTAANNGGWQWTAGTGTDAQPYFRIFNPILQSRKFDPDGSYLRRWLPELRDLADEFIHAPWEAPTPPLHYPAPLIEHNVARQRALETFKVMS
jgi:deoxyribodipyrimidine photo-lyase